MARERDLFADFDRAWGGRGRGGFTPAVDVFYAGDPPRAVVRADLAGIDPADVELEIRGRELVLAGVRRPEAADGRVYQLLEIPHGPFRRIVGLGADVDEDAARARYEHGVLVVELPLVVPSATARQVPIEGGG